MARATTFIPASASSGSCPPACPAPTGSSPTWSRSGNETRPGTRRRLSRRAGLPDLARGLPVCIRQLHPRRRRADAVLTLFCMSLLDWIVLLGTVVGIAAYGAWRTRHTDHLDTYLK